MKQDLRLLFVTEDEAKKFEITSQLNSNDPAAEIEFLSCERDGCWEADMIMLLNPDVSSCSLVEKIREVATQKIVLVASEEKEVAGKPDLRELLPWSKVVEVTFNTTDKELTFCSKDAEAKTTVQQLFETSGYQIK